jgi:hypothetical protein
MSNANNSLNKIIDGSNCIGRSISSARFQIEKVFDDDDSNKKKRLSKTASIPISKSNKFLLIIFNISFVLKDLSNESQKKIVFEENKEIGNYDTIDALPHIDHYRNIFSFTSSELKIRPTLEILHGTVKLESTIDLNNEMINSVVISNEQSSQIEIIKFGWIIGVLVCIFKNFLFEKFLIFVF